MKDDEIIEAFEKIKKYRFAGLVFFIIAAIPVAYLRSALGYFLGILIASIGIYFDRKYRCPSCGFVFNVKDDPEDMEFCMKCGIRLRKKS